MKTCWRIGWLSLALGASCVRAAEIPWDGGALAKPPETWPAPEMATNGVDALYFAGEPWKGRPTRVFAFCAVPAATNGARVPGMVLVHGGGGTAFHDGGNAVVDDGNRRCPQCRFFGIDDDSSGIDDGGFGQSRAAHECECRGSP